MHSIIIPTHGRLDSLTLMFDSLPNSLKSNDVELIIVDNNSDQKIKSEIKQLAAKFIKQNSNVRFISSEVIGLSEARHTGLNVASGSIVTFFDDDIIISEGWFSAVQNAFEDSQVHLVGGPCLPYLLDGAPNWFWNTFSIVDNGWINHFYSLVDFSNSIKNVNPEYVFGLNFSIRRETIKKVKGFNPDILPNEKQFYQGDGETGLSRKIASLNLRADFIKGALIHHQIGKERLSKEYLNKRSYFQGLVDSYSSIRKSNNFLYLKYIRYEICKLICKLLHRKNSLYNYSNGYISHQKHVAKDVNLKNWVKKAYYYDV